MPAKTLYIVQQFERQGKKLVAGRQMEFPSAQAAVARADRDAERVAGVVAITQTVDTDTGEVLEEPAVLARHGELPAGMFGDD
ncbi:hypothetical protein [Aureimonas mangrovi]|uniref:hypothetical protein n=1 Tax=Aureimonas mangrovi TaxID=2758041 RepID=UPI00163DDFF6|nr:hypothetical protein [Aureimonas mangrovi]